MSDLPKYTRVPDEVESEPLTKARDSFELQPEVTSSRAGYPPYTAEGSSSGSEHHVKYIYEPRGSHHQHVLGVLGRDRQVRAQKTILFV